MPSLPAHLDLSGSSTGDDLSLLPFCKEPAPPSEGEGLSLDHMSVSEGEWQGSEGEGLPLDHMSVSEGEGPSLDHMNVNKREWQVSEGERQGNR